MLSRNLRCLLVCAVLFGVSDRKVHASGYLLVQSQGSSSLSRNGIELFGKGDDRAAIKALRAAVKENKSDLQAWHYLGLVLERQGKIDDARKAHEKAAKLGDTLLDAFFLKVGSSDEGRYLLELHEPISLAAASAQKYISLSKKLSSSKQEEWTDRAESLSTYNELSDAKNNGDSQPHIFSSKEVTTKARVLSKPEPSYTEDARKDQITGKVVLRAVFCADGKIRGIRPVKTLPSGLTRKSISAARQIKFLPATKDGKPVSVILQLEYNFNLY